MRGVAWLGSGGTALLRWWLAELAGLVPASLRRRLAAGERVGSLWLGTDSDGGQAPLPASEAAWRALAGEVRGRRPDRWRLVLPPFCALVRLRTFEVGIGRNLRAVLATEIAHSTPFSEHEVLWGHGPAEVMDGRLTVRQVIVKRRLTEELKAAAERAGLVVAGIAVWTTAPDEASTVGVADYARHRGRLARGLTALNLVLVLVLVGAAATALTRPHLERLRRIDGLAAENAVLRQQALGETRRVSLARTERERAEVLLRRRLARPPLVELLRRLTLAVPDGGWVAELQLARDGSVRIAGFTRDGAAALLRKIAGEPGFKGARFSAPVTMDAGSERFEISIPAAP